MSQDAVGDLLGNMGGAGMRNMNADRRRHRIMQSRGTRALGEGPQAAAAIASGPAAQSAQHRYLRYTLFELTPKTIKDFHTRFDLVKEVQTDQT